LMLLLIDAGHRCGSGANGAKGARRTFTSIALANVGFGGNSGQ
jgi:hypothetical protein